MPTDRGLHGWVVIDKPQGLTSNRIVEHVRRATGAKAGHAGTLDPLATGVLPIALGEATKTTAYAMRGRKSYRFSVRWGIARATDDGEGEIVGESDARPGRAAIEAVLPRFVGTITQAPPIYSAIKVAGRRAYALARADAPPSLPSRPVEIAKLRLIAAPDRDTRRIRSRRRQRNLHPRPRPRPCQSNSEPWATSPHCADCRSGGSPRHRRFHSNP